MAARLKRAIELLGRELCIAYSITLLFDGMFGRLVSNYNLLRFPSVQAAR